MEATKSLEMATTTGKAIFAVSQLAKGKYTRDRAKASKKTERARRTSIRLPVKSPL